MKLVVTAKDHRRLLEDTHDKLRGFRKDMLRNAAYARNIQYTAEDKKYLEDTGRMAIVWPIIFQKLQAFIGAEEANRVNARVVTRGDFSDQRIADILNAVMEQDNEETDMDMQISLAARYAAIYRYAALQCAWEMTSKYPQGQYVLRALDPLDVFWDYAPHEIDFDESNYIIYTRWFTAEHIVQRFVHDPEKAKIIEEVSDRLEGTIGKTKYRKSFAEGSRVGSSTEYTISDKDQTVYKNLSDPYKRYDEYVRASEGFYRVIELHERQRDYVQFLNDYKRGIKRRLPSDITREEKNLLLQASGLADQAFTREMCDTMHLSVSAPGLNEALLFDEDYSVQGAGFSIKILPFYNLTPDRRELMSLVDTAIDMQDVVNQDLRSKAYFMAKVLNPTWLIERRAVDWETQGAAFEDKTPGNIIQVNFADRVREIFPPFGATNLFTESAARAAAQSDDISGLNQNIRGGRQSSDESARLNQSRIRQAENMLSPIYKNISRLILSIEKFHLGIIQAHMGLPRMIRLLGPGGQTEAEEKIKINDYDPILDVIKNDVTVGQYDIRPDPSKTTKTEREFQRNQIIQLMQMSPPEINLQLIPTLFKLLDIPQSTDIAERANRLLKLQELRTELQIRQLALQGMQMESQMAQLQSGAPADPKQLPPVETPEGPVE